MRLIPACLCLLALAACSGDRSPAPGPKAMGKALAGKTLTNETGARITFGKDGTLSGTGLNGVWWVSDDQVCRTLVAPERMAGTTCQKVALTEDRVTFLNRHGRSLSYRIEE